MSDQNQVDLKTPDGGFLRVTWKPIAGRAATPADLLAAVRRGVESGTIEASEIECFFCEGVGEVVHGIDCEQCALDGGVKHAHPCPECEGSGGLRVIRVGPGEQL